MLRCKKLGRDTARGFFEMASQMLEVEEAILLFKVIWVELKASLKTRWLLLIRQLNAKS